MNMYNVYISCITYIFNVCKIWNLSAVELYRFLQRIQQREASRFFKAAFLSLKFFFRKAEPDPIENC